MPLVTVSSFLAGAFFCLWFSLLLLPLRVRMFDIPPRPPRERRGRRASQRSGRRRRLRRGLLRTRPGGCHWPTAGRWSPRRKTISSSSSSVDIRSPVGMDAES